MDELTMRDYLRVLFRHKALIFLSFATVMGTVVAGLMLQTPVYQAQVKMLISAQKQVESPYYRDLVSYQNVQIAQTQSEIVQSNPVVERAVKALNLENRPADYEKLFCTPLKAKWIDYRMKFEQARSKPALIGPQDNRDFRKAVARLKDSIKVEPIRDTNIFTISVKDFDPSAAASIANVVSRSYVIFDLEQQLAEMRIQYGEKHHAVMQLGDNIKRMKKNLSGDPVSDFEAIGPASVKIIEQATPPLYPTGVPHAVTLGLAAFMAAILSLTLAFLLDITDHSFRSPKEIEKVLNIPYLVSVPRKTKPESYRSLANQLHLALKDRGFKTVLFFSATPDEGVTKTVANLASYLAKTGRHKTLVIEANLRNATIGKNFQLTEAGGLAEILEGQLTFDRAVRDCGENLHVLTAGKTVANPATLLNSAAMKELLDEVKERYEIILVDSPSLRVHSDAVILSTQVDASCLIVTEGMTRKQVVQSALAPMQQSKAVILGAILNNRRFALPKLIYDRT